MDLDIRLRRVGRGRGAGGCGGEGERAVGKGRVVPHDGVRVSQKRDAEDHVADSRRGVLEGLGGLDHADAVLGAVVVGGFGGEVEGVEGDFGSVVEGDGHVEWGCAGDVVCLYRARVNMKMGVCGHHVQFPSAAGPMPSAP